MVPVLAAYIAIPLTLLIVAWVLLTDQIMGAHRWRLTGILRVPGTSEPVSQWLGPLVIRVLLAVITSFATSYSATILICRESVVAELTQTRDATNAQKRAEGEAEKETQRRLMLGSFETDVAQAASGIAAISEQINTAQAASDAINKDILTEQLAASCEELGGPGCRRGKGPLWKARQLRLAKAQEDLQQKQSEIAALQSRRSDAMSKLDTAKSALHAAEDKFLAEVASKIDARVSAELVPFRNDPLMSFRALNKLFASPEDGEAARFYWHLLMGLLLVMELSYVMSSEWLKHASVYETRLIARTQRLAAEVAAESRRHQKRLFGGDDGDPPHPPRPELRLLPRFGEASGGQGWSRLK